MVNTQKNSLNKIAYVISAIFHPLLLPTLAFTVLFYFMPSLTGYIKLEVRWNLLLMIFSMTFVLPMLAILLLYFLGRVSSLMMHDQADRHLPFILTTLFYGVSTYFFYQKLATFPLIYVILGCITLAIGVVTVVNFFWKISAHSTGIAGVLGFILALHYRYPSQELLYPLLFICVFAGLLMTTRLYLNAHTPLQVWLGALLGLVICLGGTILLL